MPEIALAPDQSSKSLDRARSLGQVDALSCAPIRRGSKGPHNIAVPALVPCPREQMSRARSLLEIEGQGVKKKKNKKPREKVVM